MTNSCILVESRATVVYLLFRKMTRRYRLEEANKIVRAIAIRVIRETMFVIWIINWGSVLFNSIGKVAPSYVNV